MFVPDEIKFKLINMMIAHQMDQFKKSRLKKNLIEQDGYAEDNATNIILFSLLCITNSLLR